MKPNSLSNLGIVIAGMALMLVIYLAVVFIWDQTSVVNKPGNIVDLVVRTPENPRDWFRRRDHGI